MLKQGLELKQTQKLSPLQVRFVRMLEMNGPEVEDEVKHALDDNPALEVAEESEHEESDFNESAEDMQLADYGSEDEIPSYRLEARNHSASDTYYEPVAVDSSSTLLETHSQIVIFCHILSWIYDAKLINYLNLNVCRGDLTM